MANPIPAKKKGKKPISFMKKSSGNVSPKVPTRNEKRSTSDGYMNK